MITYLLSKTCGICHFEVSLTPQIEGCGFLPICAFTYFQHFTEKLVKTRGYNNTALHYSVDKLNRLFPR